MKISRVRAVNFKGIKNIDVLLKKNINKITGANGAGKSSFKDSIMATLCGAKYTPDVPVRVGQGKAEVTIDMGDFVVHGTYTKSGRRIEIESADGSVYKRPQELLDKCIGPLTFDPVAFYLAKAPVQVAMLKELVQVNFGDLDTIQWDIKQKRSKTKTEKERLTHEAERIQVVEGLPDEEVDVADVLDKLNKAQEQNKWISEITDEMQLRENTMESTNLEIESLQSQLKQKEEVWADNNRRLKSWKEKLATLNPIDTKPIQQQITNAGAVNQAIQEAARRQRLEDGAEEQSRLFSELGQQAKDVESERADRLAKCNMPVKGLSLTDEYVTFGELPLKQVNTGKQLQICVSIAMAMNTNLKTVFVKANDLDAENLILLEEMIVEKDYQALIEIVDSSGKIGIIIEDGRIKEKE